jgi:hypothetical protein
MLLPRVTTAANVIPEQQVQITENALIYAIYQTAYFGICFVSLQHEIRLNNMQFLPHSKHTVSVLKRPFI